MASGTTLGMLRRLIDGVRTSGSLAATGSAQSDAALVVNRITQVTAVDGTKGVRLPSAIGGAEYVVYNTDASNGLKIYPATGDDINDGSANAAVTIEGKSQAIFNGLDNTTWAATFTANT